MHKSHKILNSDNKLILCDGLFELFNYNTAGKKEFKRRRTLSAEYEKEELETVQVETDNSNADLLVKNSNTNDHFIDSLENISNKIEGLKSDNIVEINKNLKKCIKEEFTNLKTAVEATICEHIKKISLEWCNEFRELTKLIKQDKAHNRQSQHKNNNNETDRSIINSNIKPVETVIIKPNKEQESSVTLNQLKQSIDVANLGVGLNKVKNKAGGKIILEVEKEKDKTILLNEIQNKLGQFYNVSSVNKKRPKLKIVGLEEQLIQQNENIFIKNLVRQNDLTTSSTSTERIKIIKRYKTKGDYGSAILEVDPIIHKLLLEKNFVKIGWKTYKIFNYINVIRCFKCWSFNHFAKQCNRDVVCRICAGKHRESECQSGIKKCINCIEWVNKSKQLNWNSDHMATDSNCGCYIKMREKEQIKIVNNNK